MSINRLTLQLLEIFEEELQKREKITYVLADNINVQEHVRLHLDENTAYYARKISSLLIKRPRRENYAQLANWQLLETYRLLNTAHCSVLVKDSTKEKLSKFRTILEEIEPLKGLLAAIDKGIVVSPLVCSGHGSWELEDKFIDMSKFDSTVVLISGLGGTLSNELARDVENDLYKVENVVVVKKDEETVPVKSINPSPTFFSRHTTVKKLPDLCLVDGEKSFPKPRVIEPLTARVLFDLSILKSNKNYFSLSTVLEKLNGKNRTIGWSACTVGFNEKGNRVGDFVGYKWTNQSNFMSKKRRLEEERKLDIEMNKKTKTKEKDEEIVATIPPSFI
ncbi:DUF6863 domain-containing protein [Legionella hackeliae]|uniref:Uncharacterized protein n=1 Tax=Legionella hackeliae TaxID=449 RepID=A0A0A8UM88_LEGHA|nr:hypothetical protein [Legionella hackeliae]KTD10481.1 hypothetical protein Lhac_2849 [Legionella hackeliae]CEK09985.1 protein of unknown function [Legionella hackeliae]STX49899.1 Uncharacterised protein [Legionella hackeliae]